MLDKGMKSILKFCQRYMEVVILIAGSSFSVDMACQAYGCLTRQGYGKSLFCFPDPVKKK